MKLYLKRILFAVISVQMAMVASFELFAQNVTVTGTVKDAATNELLVGATVMVKGTTNGVSTDINGHYSIKAKAEDVLVCSIIGYKSVESKVGSKAVVDYALQPDNQLLDATVVVGYGTLKKTQLVGSVENLDGGVIENRPNANVTRSLQGQVPVSTSCRLTVRQHTQVLYISEVTVLHTIPVRTSAAVLPVRHTVSEARDLLLFSSTAWKAAFRR